MGYFSNFSHLVLYDPRLHASMNVHSADKLLKEFSDSSTDSRTKDQKEKALADALQLVKDTKAALDDKKPESPVTPETPETPETHATARPRAQQVQNHDACSLQGREHAFLYKR